MRILLAIDSSDASRKAVKFVGEILSGKQGGQAHVTLFHVVESLPDYLVSRTTSSDAFRQVAEELSNSSQEDGQRLLKENRSVLLELGVPPQAVETKLETRDCLPEAKKVVAAMGIIDEMNAGPYDVVCVGRRGTSGSAGSFPGSVAEKVLRQGHGKTIWVVD